MNRLGQLERQLACSCEKIEYTMDSGFRPARAECWWPDSDAGTPSLRHTRSSRPAHPLDGEASASPLWCCLICRTWSLSLALVNFKSTRHRFVCVRVNPSELGSASDHRLRHGHFYGPCGVVGYRVYSQYWKCHILWAGSNHRIRESFLSH